MLLTEDELKSRLDSPRNLANRFSRKREIDVLEVNKDSENEEGVKLEDRGVTHIDKGRHVGRAGVVFHPQEVKNLAGGLARSGMTTRAVAKQMGLSQQTVHDYSHGRDGAELPVVEDMAAKARDVALERLMETLGLLTPDKVAGCKAGEISTIATNMSRIAHNMTPHKEASDTNINLVVYSPQQRIEGGYKVIEVASQNKK